MKLHKRKPASKKTWAESSRVSVRARTTSVVKSRQTYFSDKRTSPVTGSVFEFWASAESVGERFDERRLSCDRISSEF